MMTRFGTSSRCVNAHKQREFNHPHVSVWTFMHWRSPKIVAKCSQYLAGGHPFIGHDQTEVARFGCETIRE